MFLLVPIGNHLAKSHQWEDSLWWNFPFSHPCQQSPSAVASLPVGKSRGHSVHVPYVKIRQELSRSSFLNHDFFLRGFLRTQKEAA